MEILGVIPARGGSKGIPLKNIVKLDGKPLIWYSCEAALKSEYLSRIIVDTDDAKIREVSQDFGVEVPFLREAYLAEDNTLIIDTLKGLINRLADIENYTPDIVVLLQPTSPLRTSQHIDEAIQLFLTKKPDTLVSVTEVPHQFTPESVLNIKNQLLVNYIDKKTKVLRRQEKPKFYARNGPSILINKTENIKAGKLYGKTVLPYVMDAFDSIDIDSPLDLEYCSFLMKNAE